MGYTKKERYERALTRNLEEELHGEHVLCPKCGVRYVTPRTEGEKNGVCQVCYLRALSEAARAAAAEVSAQTEFDKNRQARARANRARVTREGKKDDKQR